MAVVRRNATIDSDKKEQVRASLRRLLARYKYPPDKQESAVLLVMQQAELFRPRARGLKPPFAAVALVERAFLSSLVEQRLQVGLRDE